MRYEFLVINESELIKQMLGSLTSWQMTLGDSCDIQTHTDQL